MNLFLVQFKYTEDAWDHFMANPGDFEARIAAVRGLLSKLGGSLPAVTFPGLASANGLTVEKFCPADQHEVQDDVVTIIAFETAEGAMAFGDLLRANKGVEQLSMTALVTYQTAFEALKKADEQKTSYSFPGT